MLQNFLGILYHFEKNIYRHSLESNFKKIIKMGLIVEEAQGLKKSGDIVPL
jgi:hypothetical protein